MENENDIQEAATDPDFLVNMKLRERYRKNRRDEIRRNQYIKAQERLRKKVFTCDISVFLNIIKINLSIIKVLIFAKILMQVEQEALKAREEKEEREKIKLERKELRKKIRQREEAKKARAAYLLEMSQKADKFYEQKWLLVHFGFVPWKQYLADAKLRMFQAENHCKVIFFLIILNTYMICLQFISFQ